APRRRRGPARGLAFDFLRAGHVAPVEAPAATPRLRARGLGGAVAILELLARTAGARRVAADLAPGARIVAIEAFRRERGRVRVRRRHLVLAGERVLMDLVGLRRGERTRQLLFGLADLQAKQHARDGRTQVEQHALEQRE